MHARPNMLEIAEKGKQMSCVKLQPLVPVHERLHPCYNCSTVSVRGHENSYIFYLATQTHIIRHTIISYYMQAVYKVIIGKMHRKRKFGEIG